MIHAEQLARPPSTRPAAVPAAPSGSARSAAMIRALLDRPTLPTGDPRAETMLAASLLDGRARANWQFMAARTRFIDDALLTGLSDGIDQVVILGAGYDGRALRFRCPAVRYFELDLPVTQDDKRRRMRTLGLDEDAVTFVPADLAADRLADLLRAAGHDGRRRTLFICEGVLLYLPAGAVRRLLSDARARSAAGGTLVATFAVAPAGTATTTVAATAARRGPDETRQSFFTPATAVELLNDCGWCSQHTQHPDARVAAEDDVALFVRATAYAAEAEGGQQPSPPKT